MRLTSLSAGLFSIAFALPGCNSLQGNVTIGAVGATALGSSMVTHEVEQIYYFGVFDPQDQVPPEVYRVRVHGQASAISFAKFASGWVPASVIDSLSSHVGFDKDSAVAKVSGAPDDSKATLQTGRRLVMFGPEGFREAPKDHRLVVVMGSDPSAFFSAIDQSLGLVAEAIGSQRNDALVRTLFEQLVKTKSESDRLADLARDLAIDLPAQPVQVVSGATP